jgi:hypothetical protein
MSASEAEIELLPKIAASVRLLFAADTAIEHLHNLEKLGAEMQALDDLRRTALGTRNGCLNHVSDPVISGCYCGFEAAVSDPR